MYDHVTIYSDLITSVYVLNAPPTEISFSSVGRALCIT